MTSTKYIGMDVHKESISPVARPIGSYVDASKIGVYGPSIQAHLCFGGRSMSHYYLRSVRNRLLAVKNLLFTPLPGASPSSIHIQAVEETIGQLENQIVEVEDLERAALALHRKSGYKIKSCDGKSEIQVSVMSTCAPWLRLAPLQCQTPSMISTEEMQYYRYIGAFYEGIGCAVELGPWLGSSTQHIVQSLIGNPNFRGKQLHVVDDFIWRADWMNGYVSDDEKLPNYASFRHLFDKYTSEVRHLLCVQQAKLANYDGNESVDQFRWGDDAIEFLYIDCGRTIAVNNAWYSYLRPRFIPGRTLLMMQDWRVHRERPRKWFNQTLLFTESKGSELELLHEVREGWLATFLFTG
jgi:hypothetical protein